MAGLIPQSFIDDLLHRSDIVEVVDKRVALKKSGKNYQACCPFHNEKTPSFSVQPERQFYYCFGCGAGGNAIGFVMNFDHVDFPQAVEILARDAGLEVPREESYRYGVIAGEEEELGIIRISDMVEKPAPEDAPSNLAIIGRYVLTPEIFDILDDTPPGKNGEIQITDALLTQARRGNVIGFKFQGKRFDCGSIPGFVEATNFVYENLY